MVVSFGWFLARASGLRTPRPALRILGAGLVSAMVAARLAPSGLAPAGAAAVAVYAVVLAATGVVRRADVARLRVLVSPAATQRGAAA